MTTPDDFTGLLIRLCSIVQEIHQLDDSGRRRLALYVLDGASLDVADRLVLAEAEATTLAAAGGRG